MAMEEGAEITIERNTMTNGTDVQPVILRASKNCKITIKRNCMIANNIEMHTTDYHTIISAEGLPTNEDADIYIGEYTWMGIGCLVLKGVTLQGKSMVAARSVVTKSILESNCLIAGNPAKIVKKPIDWNIDHCYKSVAK